MRCVSGRRDCGACSNRGVMLATMEFGVLPNDALGLAANQSAKGGWVALCGVARSAIFSSIRV